MITLNATAAYGRSGQYVAEITGRHSKFNFTRDFRGKKSGKNGTVTSYSTDQPGLYMACDINKHGSKDENFFLVGFFGETLVSVPLREESAMEIATGIDSGRPTTSIVITQKEDGKYSIRGGIIDGPIQWRADNDRSLAIDAARKALADLTSEERSLVLSELEASR